MLSTTFPLSHAGHLVPPHNSVYVLSWCRVQIQRTQKTERLHTHSGIPTLTYVKMKILSVIFQPFSSQLSRQANRTTRRGSVARHNNTDRYKVSCVSQPVTLSQSHCTWHSILLADYLTCYTIVVPRAKPVSGKGTSQRANANLMAGWMPSHWMLTRQPINRWL